ncbi:MAG: hypothetical protein H0T66_17480 [Geodermatophilaceae bacterium]|nr:hypothetical protein [Geodermatophilaceae bacterium]MDQ3457658.1 hypothetical protein [Actinomycetota bacterium]
MSIVETLLVYVGIPAAIYAVIAVLVFARGGAKTTRYRPGKPWAHEPVWYLPRPVSVARHAAVPELTAGASAAPARTARGGASGTW